MRRFTFLALVLLILVRMATFAANDSIENLDWEGLVRDTGTAPIVIKPGSISDAEFRKQHYAWLKRELIEPELARLKGTPAEAELAPLVEFAGKFAASQNTFGIPQKIRAHAVAVVKGKERRPAVDFLCGYLLESAANPDAIFGFKGVCAEPAPEGFPKLFRVYARGRVLSHADNFEKAKGKEAQNAYFDELTHFLQSEPPKDSVQWIVMWLLKSPMESMRINREPRHIDLVMKSKLPEWAKLTLAGSMHYRWGWNANGRGMGYPKPGGEQTMKQQLKLAREKLTKACELNPAIPFAATEMLRVVANQGLEKGETLRQWLDRAMVGVFDYELALLEFVDVSRPYWVGNHSDMMAFGKVCADTKRFDSNLPTVFNDCVHRIALDVEDWAQLFQSRELAKLLLDTRRNRARQSVGTPDEMSEFSMLFVESWLCRDYEGAAKALEPLAFEGDFRIASGASVILDTLNLNVAFVLRDTLLRTSKGGADYLKGVEALKNDRFAEAVTLFEAVEKHAHPLSLPLLRADITLAKFQEQFARGEWTKLPVGEWYCWLDLAGDMASIKSIGGMQLSSKFEFSKVLFRGKLGDNFELRGHQAHSRPPHPGGLGIFNGHTPMGSGRGESFWWTMRIDCDGPEKSLMQWAPKYDGADDNSKMPRAKTKGVTDFRYRCENGVVTLGIAGKEKVCTGKLPADAPSGEGAFGFGILGRGKGCSTEIWDVEVRRIKQ